MTDHDSQAELMDAALAMADLFIARELRARGTVPKLAPEKRYASIDLEKRLVAAAKQYRKDWTQ